MCQWMRGNRIFLLLYLVSQCIAGAPQLVRLLGVHVPSQRTVRHNALLKCIFELHPPAALYSVKWYKDGSEFYRYIPGDNPAAQTFSLPGVSVNMRHSNQQLVTLDALELESSGIYLCEVSTEAPFFHTVSGKGSMTVIAAAPTGGPLISGLRGLYIEGHLVEINCTSSPSKPAASITWYINGQQADMDSVIEYGVTKDEATKLDVRIAGLRLEANHDTFHNRVLQLKCVTQLGFQQRWTFLIQKHNSKTGSASRSTGVQLRILPSLMVLGTALYTFIQHP